MLQQCLSGFFQSFKCSNVIFRVYKDLIKCGGFQILKGLNVFSESLSSKDQESKDPQTCEEMGASALLQWKSLIVVTGSPYRSENQKIHLYSLERGYLIGQK
jgi:hypothetical protein